MSTTQTALYLSGAGAQRVTINAYVNDDGTPNPEGSHAYITDRDGVSAVVERAQLVSVRTEDV